MPHASPVHADGLRPAGSPSAATAGGGLATPIAKAVRRLGIRGRKALVWARARTAGRDPKALLLTTPPGSLRNLGDHAQVLGIAAWLRDHLPDLPLVEFDKNEVIRSMPTIRSCVHPGDLVLLQSGGNLGDAGIWSETARRAVIQALPDHPIVILPQTISFRDTPDGRRELEVTKRIYNAHPRLTVIARDPVSESLARDYFPRCTHALYPDFALYLCGSRLVEEAKARAPRRRGVLLVLREDEESALLPEQRAGLREVAETFGETTLYSTLVDRDVMRARRRKEIVDSLSLFARHEVVITDRFHGIVFSVLTGTPCVALGSANHKLSASSHWFGASPSIVMDTALDEVAARVEALRNRPVHMEDRWKERYFDDLFRLVTQGARHAP